MIYEEVSEEVEMGNDTYLVEGCHRDWRPLPGTTPPEGTVWELTTTFEGHKGPQSICGAGQTKEEAIKHLSFMVGFQTGVNAIGRHL
jgi:hypothetical protein